jgi:hypothetical protein
MFESGLVSTMAMGEHEESPMVIALHRSSAMEAQSQFLDVSPTNY